MTRSNLAVNLRCVAVAWAAPGVRRVAGRPTLAAGRARIRYRRPRLVEAGDPAILRLGWLALAAWPVLLAGLLGVAVGVDMAQPELRQARIRVAEAEATAEILDSHAQWLACEYLHAEQWVHGLPGFAAFGERAEIIGEALPEDLRAECRGGSLAP